MEGQARPPNLRHTLESVVTSGRAARHGLRPRSRARSKGPQRVVPRLRAGAALDPTGQPALRPGARKVHPQIGTAPSSKEGHRTHKMPRQDVQCADKMYTSVARGARPCPAGRQGGGHPHPPGRCTEVSATRPLRPVPPPPRCPTARRPRKGGRRRPTLPCGLAVRPTRDPSPDDRPLPPCVPPWGWDPHTPWPGHSPGTWRPRQTRGDACERQLTPGGRGERRPLASLLEPAQRPRPPGSVPPGHIPTTPGAGGLHR